MAAKPIVYTTHASDSLRERVIDKGWVAEAVERPDWTEADRTTSGAERRFKVISEHGDRVLRVVCFETPDEIRILTVFFDRRARHPR